MKTIGMALISLYDAMSMRNMDGAGFLTGKHLCLRSTYGLAYSPSEHFPISEKYGLVPVCVPMITWNVQ